MNELINDLFIFRTITVMLREIYKMSKSVSIHEIFLFV